LNQIMSDCVCYKELTELNDMTSEFSDIHLYMMNMRHDDQAYLQARSGMAIDTVPINYCPMCGRYLGERV